jgi:hypothetical protein
MTASHPSGERWSGANEITKNGRRGQRTDGEIFFAVRLSFFLPEIKSVDV